jgi:arginase
MRPVTVLDAPSNLGLRPPRPGAEPGVRAMAATLRSLGIVERLGADDAGGVEAPPYSPDPEPATGFRNGPAVARFTRALAGRTGALLSSGRFPVVLGGDCSIVLGPVLALRRRGRYGLAHIDGHDDYSYARAVDDFAGRFAAAGLDLALATGHGPDALCDIDGLRPYVAETDAVQIGLNREPDDAVLFQTETFDNSPIRRYPAGFIRAHGADEVAAEARGHLEKHQLDGFWMHLDADVLDASVMPAVDSPNPGGLSFGELTTILATLLASPRVVGMHVGIYDPELDPDRSLGAALVDALVDAFTRS